jgi:hypothetical protein
MTAETDHVPHPRSVNTSGGAALVAMITSIAAALYFGVGALQLDSFTCWSDRVSDSFELRPGTSGMWKVTWEPDNGRDPLRPIWLIPPPFMENSEAYGGADVLVRVDPADAVAPEFSGVRVEEWLSVSTFSPSDLRGSVPIDPRRVQRIEYRVDRVQPTFEGTRVQLFVPGNPDSEHPDWAPFFLGASVSVALLGVLPSFFWYRRSRSRRDEQPAA